MTVTAWPQHRNGDLVWACCVSSIGPRCRHRSDDDGYRERLAAGCDLAAGSRMVAERIHRPDNAPFTR